MTFLGVSGRTWWWCGVVVYAAVLACVWAVLAAGREEDERHGRLEEQADDQ